MGAGIIGASIAWRLAARGLCVTLLDAGEMGAEASWAGAGMLSPGGEAESASEFSAFCLESLKLYPEYVAALEAESGVAIDFQRQGAVEVALTAQECEALEARAAAQRGFGIDSQPFDARALPLLGRPVAGALFYPADSLVDPRHVMRALRVACVARGVGIREGWRVDTILGANVAGPRGSIAAGAVVLAAGAWSSRIQTNVAIPAAIPVKGHLIGYDLPPAPPHPILRHGHTYILQRATGQVVAGTSTEHAGFDRSIDSAVAADIARRAEDLAPVLRVHGPPAPWCGFRPGLASEGDPCIQQADSRIWLAYGHYRNGILLAPATAERVAASVAGP